MKSCFAIIYSLTYAALKKDTYLTYLLWCLYTQIHTWSGTPFWVRWTDLTQGVGFLMLHHHRTPPKNVPNCCRRLMEFQWYEHTPVSVQRLQERLHFVQSIVHHVVTDVLGPCQQEAIWKPGPGKLIHQTNKIGGWWIMCLFDRQTWLLGHKRHETNQTKQKRIIRQRNCLSNSDSAECIGWLLSLVKGVTQWYNDTCFNRIE